MSRARGEGTLSRRADGRWEARLMVGGRRVSVYGDTKQEAAEKLKALIRSTEPTGRLPDAGKLLLADYLDELLTLRKGELRPKTQALYADLVRLFIAPALGTVKLKDVRPLHLQRLCAAVAKRSPRRAQQVYTFVHMALGRAVRLGLLATNPADGLDCPRYTPDERPVWTAVQASRCIRALLDSKGGTYGVLWGYLLGTGCRVGEGLGLDWEDVDLNAGTVALRRQVTFLKGTPIEGELKTARADRTLALPAWAMELLARQRERTAGRGRVFCSCTGTIPQERNLRRAFGDFCRQLALPVIPIHALRHSYATLTLEAGVSLAEVSKALGHSKVTTTANVYAHATTNGRAVAAAMERLCPQVNEPAPS